MSNIEELVRQSLQQRAEDVDATPALWQEVDRRVTRRRRLQVATWSLAGAAAVVAGLLIVPGLVAGVDPIPEVEPLLPGPEEGTDEADASDVAEDDTPPEGVTEDAQPEETVDEPVEDGAGVEEVPADGAAVTLTEPVLVASQRTISLLGSDGRREVLEMPAEGESWIMGLAVRPGSTVDDYTAAVLTTAEGFWDLRHLHVVDGEVVVWEVFPQVQHRPWLSREALMGAQVTGPVFSPDGDALAWIEGPPEELRLRVIGWGEEGPGTGARATDNTSLAVELPGSATGLTPVLQDWTWSSDTAGEGRSVIAATTDGPTAAAWYIPLDRGPDGAWSQAPDGPQGGIGTDVAVTEDGVTYAVHGTIGDGAPEWMVRWEDDRLVLHHDPFGDEVGRSTTSTDLPGDLLPGEGLPLVWVRSVGDVALVGSPNTNVAFAVDRDGDVAQVPDVAHADTIR